MGIYENLVNKITEKTKEFGFTEKADIRTFNCDGANFEFVAVENTQTGMGIAISYSEDEEEWTVEYLGYHEHIPDSEDAAEIIIFGHVLPVLADLLAVVKLGDGVKVCVAVPEVQNNDYTAEQLGDCGDAEVLCWSGSLPEDIRARCIAEAKKVSGFYF